MTSTTSIPAPTSTATRRHNPWIVHCKAFRAAHPSLTWRDVLISARETYTKVQRPKSPDLGFTWNDHVRNFSGLAGLSYSQSVRHHECRQAWTEMKAAALSTNTAADKPVSPEAPTKLAPKTPRRTEVAPETATAVPPVQLQPLTTSKTGEELPEYWKRPESWATRPRPVKARQKTPPPIAVLIPSFSVCWD